MPNQYATSADFQNMKLGVKVNDLAPGELDLYLQSATAWVEEYLGYACASKTISPEYLYTDSSGRALIQNSGHVLLMPVQAYPIVSISQIQWRSRGLPLASMSASSSAVSSSNLVPIDSSNYQIEQDRYGDGWRVRIFLDYTTWRNPNIILEFQLTYTGGYTPDGNGNYPMWLRAATIQYCAHLLKSRGGQAVAMNGEGVVMDPGFSGGHMGKAKDFLNPHRRIF